MIRISTRGRYALRAMVDLAQHGDKGPVSRQDISERQEISADYLAQLFVHLQAAGLVEGVKGPGGGYRLARDARLIRAGDVVQAVEGPVAVRLAPRGRGLCLQPCGWLRDPSSLEAALRDNDRSTGFRHAEGLARSSKATCQVGAMGAGKTPCGDHQGCREDTIGGIESDDG
jgi:Rrf2 family protein